MNTSHGFSAVGLRPSIVKVYQWATTSFLCLSNPTSWTGLELVASTYNSDTASVPKGPGYDNKNTAVRVRGMWQLYQRCAQLSPDPCLKTDSPELWEGCAGCQNCIGRLRALGVTARQRRYSTLFVKSII
jgi:hypothetical protein